MSSMLALFLGCSPGTIVTVQPGAVDKAALDGEWYWRRTVSDVPYGTAATFTGAEDELDRIHWEVQEDLLVGYRSYAHIAADGAEDTAPLLVFPILDQFDIRRGYDPVTGEENNVVQENRDLPWYERQYLRVDWSQNRADEGFTFAGSDLQLLSWVANDDSADAPQFDDTNGDGVIDSLLLTQRALVEPDTEYIPGYGDVPVCLFFGQAEYECAATEIGIRHSFVKVGDRGAYDGLVYDDKYMETFGYFSTERLAWTEGYGLLEPARLRYANLHPLWEESFERDADGEILCRAHGEVAACETFSVADDPKPKTLKYAERVPRPVVYHAGPGFLADLAPIMSEVAEMWSAPLRDTVNELRYWECVDADGEVADCEARKDESLQMFVWCPNNPSLPSDPAACSTDYTGPEGRPDGTPDQVEIGDLRFHLAHVVSQPNLTSPYGYGPSAADPLGTTIQLTDGELPLGAGEIIEGNAFLYEPVLDRVSHQVADLVQLLNGEISPDAFVEGEDLTAWLATVTAGGKSAPATYGVSSAWSRAQVAGRLAKMDNGFGDLLRPYLAGVGPLTDVTQHEAWLAAATGAIDQSGVFGAGAAEADANLLELYASPYDELAWTDETVGGYGFDPAQVGVEGLGGLSPFDALDPLLAAEREQARISAGLHAVDLDSEASFSDSTLLGLARDYAARGLTYEEIVQDVREQSFREVMLHEIGHTLGLRHNFSGSFDAFNFRPEYWALRDDGNMGPRHVDPETDAEVNGRIREFQYSTVMDYPGSRNVGWIGLGHYDHAAIKFGYGELVEVLTAVPRAPAIEGLPNDQGIAYVSSYASSNVFPSVLLNYTSGEFLSLHYTQFPAIAGDLEARADVPIDHLEGTLSETGSFADGLEVADTAGDVTVGMPAVPYRFCGDEFAVGMTCDRFDEGADPYEVISFYRERYFNDYILTNFARERYGFGDPDAYVSRLDDRIFDPIRTWQRYYALFHAIFDVDGDPFAAALFADDNGWGGWTAGTDESLRMLVQVITRPEAGPHAPITRPDGVEVLAPGFATDEDIPIVTGAYFESLWDYDSGYYWFERQTRVGTYWDKMLALQSLANTSSYDYLGYDTASDPRQYAIGYQDLYRDPLAILLGRVMSDDVAHLAPARLASGEIVYPDPLDPSASWPPPGSTLVQPANYWLVRFDADLFGLALLDHGYDRTFLNRARIYLEGTGDAPTPAPGQAVVTYSDASTGKTYSAWSFPDASGDELGASARMLQRANALEARCADGALDPADARAACAELARYTADLDLHLEMYESFQHDAL